MEQTISLARELPLDWASFSITQPLPRTGIHEDMLARGDAQDDYWRDYTLLKVSRPPGYFESEGLDAGQLEALLHQAYRGFYLRLPFLARQASKVLRRRQIRLALATTRDFLGATLR